MKTTKTTPKDRTPDALTLEKITQRFGTEDAAREYLESVRWPKGPICPHCGNADAKRMYDIAANPAKRIRPGIRQCVECQKQFTVTVGTIFEDSHIPLNKWLIAWYMLCASKKGISALQMQRMLSLGSYRSAWFMMHRIRYALRDPVFSDKLGGSGGTVEADETFLGNKPGRDTRRGFAHKNAIFSLVERKGRVRSFHVPNVTAKTLKPILQAHMDSKAHLMTDDAGQYRILGPIYASHQTIAHSRKEYVRGPVHTNTIEGFFSLFKRGVNGTFHHIGQQYLDQYLAEFDFRYNHRDITDGERTIAGLRKINGKRLMLRTPL